MGIILNESEIDRFIRKNGIGNTVVERNSAMMQFVREQYESGAFLVPKKWLVRTSTKPEKSQ